MYSLKFRELLMETPGLYEELDLFVKQLVSFLLTEHNEDGTHIVDDPTTDVAAASLPYVTVGNSSGLSAERALVGTSGEIDVTDNGANSTVAIGLPAAITLATSVTAPAVVGSTSATAPTVTASSELLIGGAAGAATTARVITKKVTGIADNTPTDVLTVTIPNANHAGALRLLLLSSNGSTDAFESSRAAQGLVVFQRNTGVVAVATAAAIADGVIATNATGGSATHTLAYAVSAVSGAAGAANTFTVTVTIDDSGNLGSNQVVAMAELLNAEATGITIA